MFWDDLELPESSDEKSNAPRSGTGSARGGRGGKVLNYKHGVTPSSFSRHVSLNYELNRHHEEVTLN